MIKVEVGCGNNNRKEYIKCDARKLDHVDYVCNAWEIPFNNNSVDEIYSRHMLEHLTYNEAIKSVNKWYSALKIDGIVDVCVPDLEVHIKQFFEEGNSPIGNVTNRDHAMAGFYGWQTYDYDVHKWGYTFKTLCKLLSSAGFSDIKKIDGLHKFDLRVVAKK